MKEKAWLTTHQGDQPVQVCAYACLFVSRPLLICVLIFRPPPVPQIAAHPVSCRNGRMYWAKPSFLQIAGTPSNESADALGRIVGRPRKNRRANRRANRRPLLHACPRPPHERIGGPPWQNMVLVYFPVLHTVFRHCHHETPTKQALTLTSL